MTSGATINVRLTGFHPFMAGMTAAQRLMEGGTTDSHGKALHTLESYLRGEAEYVSVAGDDAIWPYGQRISLSGWPGVVFRVVDTGGHFRGAGKLYRVAGREPLDVCCEAEGVVRPREQTCTIHVGDAWGSHKTPDEVAFDRFPQGVVS